MNLIANFVDKPVVVQFSIFWLVMMTIVMTIFAPYFALFFILGMLTVLAITNLIVYFVEKGVL